MPVLIAAAMIVFLSSTEAAAGDVFLIRVSEEWRYLKGVSEPSEPPNDWREAGFDDRVWLKGISGFSFATYFPEATGLPDYGLNYKTVYFRKDFEVPDTNAVKWLTMRIDYQDGFIAYLNGQEIARRGVAGELNVPVGVTAWATNHLHGPTEEIDVSHAIPHLRNGTNLLAVQVLGSETGTGFWFIAELTANFTRAPFLQSTSTNSTLIAWKTKFPLQSFVEYGLSTNEPMRLELALPQTNHLASITNLQSDTTYQYRVGVTDGANEEVTEWRTFRTFKESGPVSFSVLGDSGFGSLGQYMVADRMREAATDLVMHAGDVIYYGFTHYAADFRCLSVYTEQKRTTPFFYVVGNHEMYLDRAAMLQTFYLPTNSVTGTEHYYSFDHGDAHFVVLWTDLWVGADYSPGSPQYNWLELDLANSEKPWKFLFFHHTLRTSSLHAADDYDANQIPDSQQLKAIESLAGRHGVQIIFNGHDHTYERFTPVDGPISYVSGGGGVPLYTRRYDHPASVQYYNSFHFLKVTVEGEETVVEGIDHNGKAFEAFHIRRSFPERRAYPAEWHTPRIESAPPDDNDGNITGQTYDFHGTPVTPLRGMQSSSGRLWVNNDRDHLYLGLDEVSLQVGQNLFLFVGSGTNSGVTSMEGIGNGIIDPEGEGADGLDFLENLAFTNFTPTIGLILGDEFGDHHFRSFSIPGQTLNLGQGAFHLSSELPEVPGQSLQQFNRSPQLLPLTYERNADLIELAVPYSTLGEIQPGDTVQIGGIVGLWRLDTNLGRRELDTGGLAVLTVTNDAGTTFLEPLEFRLAKNPDPDNDGLTDAEEAVLGTNPVKSDTDEDGLPDGWEYVHQFDPLNGAGEDGGDGDADGDGQTNYDEFIAGTSPLNADSQFAMLMDRPNPTELRLTWNTVFQRTYTLEYYDPVAETFETVADGSFPRLGTGSMQEHLITVPMEDSDFRYFRIKVSK